MSTQISAGFSKRSLVFCNPNKTCRSVYHAVRSILTLLTGQLHAVLILLLWRADVLYMNDVKPLYNLLKYLNIYKKLKEF